MTKPRYDYYRPLPYRRLSPARPTFITYRDVLVRYDVGEGWSSEFGAAVATLHAASRLIDEGLKRKRWA